MIVWLNGPFGVGKTTLARKLSTILPGSVIFDPEYLGFLFRWSHDFQEIRLWRTLTGYICLTLGKFSRRTVIVPMTVANAAYLDEIFEIIISKDVELRHFYLSLPEHELRARILNDKRKMRNQKVSSWRLSQMERCLSAEDKMPAGTVFLPAASTTRELAAEIQRILREK